MSNEDKIKYRKYNGYNILESIKKKFIELERIMSNCVILKIPKISYI